MGKLERKREGEQGKRGVWRAVQVHQSSPGHCGPAHWVACP